MGNVHTVPATAETNSNCDIKVDSKVGKAYDPFRDGYLRYLGYANEVGESFKQHISRSVYLASYALATAYVCADTAHKAQLSYERGDKKPKIFMNAGDAFLWQMFASVIVPGYVINRVTYLTRRLVRLKHKASPVIRYAPVAVGLLAIPFVIHPIDDGVSWVMDNSIRKLYPMQDDGEK